jgi:hypothetical protein
MMFRSGWASKIGQERILGVRLKREFFERALRSAVASAFDASKHGSIDAWREALRASEVRLQWDPDHTPSGTPLARRAIQLGLRGSTLAEYAGPAILEILDLTPLAVAERANAVSLYTRLRTPVERIFVPKDEAAVVTVGLDPIALATFPPGAAG